uniref:Putative membrane protein insertion efficiency factor n=1 Tax=Desulfomonile tiedjei TaxID=2358 RepID=A0A7C4AT25_9BACT
MSLTKRVLVGVIRFYQVFLSPLFPSACRFYPTCSEYAILAVVRYGPAKGAWLAVKRLVRCRPFGPGGYDPVP